MSAPDGKERDSVKVRFAKDGLGDMDVARAYFRNERESAAGAKAGQLPDLGFDGDVASVEPLMPRKKYWQRDDDAESWSPQSPNMQTAAVDNLVESMMHDSVAPAEDTAPQGSAQFDLIT
jgi:hypothetical protein